MTAVDGCGALPQPGVGAKSSGSDGPMHSPVLGGAEHKSGTALPARRFLSEVDSAL